MAMAAGPVAEGEPLSEINTTPLIDVMLVLLIMLIVTLPPQRHAVKLDTPLPPPPDAPPPPPDLPDPIRIMVDFDGSILWNGTVVNCNTLDAEPQDRGRPCDAAGNPYRAAPARRSTAWSLTSWRRRSGTDSTKMGVIGGT